MEVDAGHQIRVLLVDDDEDDYLLVKQIFQKIPDSPFSLEWTADYDEAQTSIDAERHDVYLVDYQLGNRTGLDLLRHAHPEKRRQPFILLTGLDDRSLERKTSQMAASDYLVKGSFDATLLSRTLYYALERKRFEQARIDDLLDLNQQKDEFISIASHQLRTPATAVKQYIGMVLDGFAGEITDSQRSLLESAFDSNERQLQIVSDLLKVAQVDANTLRLHWREADINALLQAIINDLDEVTKSRRQKIIFEPLEPSETIWADEEIVRMVIENIFENASKYSPEDTTITVRCINQDNEIKVCIIDEGVGVKPEDEKKLFEKFSRIDNPLSTKVGGTGLGLYWAKKIIDLHGGRIEYSSNQPKGSIFTVLLPKNA